MGPLIELTLRGDGRVVVITPATVRAAFFRFVTVNRLKYQALRGFEAPRQQSPSRQTTVLDRLFRRSERSSRNRFRARTACLPDAEAAYLTASEIRGVDRQMNRMLLQEGMALVEDEGRIDSGLVSARGMGLHRRQSFYSVRHGIIFELEELRRDVLLQGGRRDVVIESPEYTVQIARFLGITTDLRQGRVVLHFAQRLDLERTWAVPLADFPCRRLFTVRRLAAGEGFRLTGPIPFGCG